LSGISIAEAEKEKSLYNNLDEYDKRPIKYKKVINKQTYAWKICKEEKWACWCRDGKDLSLWFYTRLSSIKNPYR